MFLQLRGRPNVSSDTRPVSQLRTMSAILGPVWNSSHILVEGKAAGAGDRHGLIPGVNLSKPFNVSGLQGFLCFKVKCGGAAPVVSDLLRPHGL